MADTTNLKAAIDEMIATVARTKGVNQSAIALLTNFSAIITQKVTEALTADNAADQGSIDAATAAITAATAEATASTDALGAAVTANS